MLRNSAVFELIRSSDHIDHILLPQKFHGGISNGSTVIALTNKQTDRQTHPQTDRTENNPPRYAIAARMANTMSASSPETTRVLRWRLNPGNEVGKLFQIREAAIVDDRKAR